jgi:hypothetical protein
MSTSDFTSRQSGGQISMKTENANCLDGMKCPKCGSLEPFSIEVRMMVAVSDDGTEDYGNAEWEDASYCECRACCFHGIAGDFRIDRAAKPLLPYSVLLLYPDYISQGDHETYFAHVDAANPVQAIQAARQMAAAAQKPAAVYDPDDFASLICIAGHHEAELLHGDM